MQMYQLQKINRVTRVDKIQISGWVKSSLKLSRERLQEIRAQKEKARRIHYYK